MKLSKRVVDGLEINPTDYFVWDSEMPGFGIRVLPSGRKSYLIQYRDIGRRTRRKIIGRHGTVTADDARKQARILLAGISQGANPAEDLARRRDAATVEELGVRFLSEYAAAHCKPKTVDDYRRSIRLMINPVVGNLKVEEISRRHVAELLHKNQHRPYAANRAFAVLSIMMTQAEIWGLRNDGSNPCRNVKKFKEQKRERFLTTEELERLGATMAEIESAGSDFQSAINCFRLLILTGCRLGEIQTLKWEYIRGNSIWLPDSKTGAKRVYLGDAALDVLAGITPAPDNPYVISGYVPGTYLNDLQKPWRFIRKQAGLDNLRIHDLRHSFASVAVGMGESLPIIGKLLGHTNVQTTSRYAHLADNPIEMAAQRISNQLAVALTAKA